MFEGVQTRTGSKHPTRKDPLGGTARAKIEYFQKDTRFGGFLWRTLFARPDKNAERAETHLATDRCRDRRYPRRDLVQGAQHRNRSFLRKRRQGGQHESDHA